MSWKIALAERRLLPDRLVRMGIRQLLGKRLAGMRRPNPWGQQRLYAAFLRNLSRTPIAIATDEANEQHYEVPTEFFSYVMGRHMKYSCCYFTPSTHTLDDAEAEMLAKTARRADLRDGIDILELGCGWGSLTLWMAKHYPNSRILAVSNSRTQREYIIGEAKKRGLSNVEVLTHNVKTLELERRFDRIVSVEMFEHMRNYRELFRKVAGFLKPGGKLFVHVFVHGTTPYPFDTEGADNWMGRYFFTGGVMPSDDLFYRFQDELVLRKHWRVNGRHYQRTSECWLENMDRNRDSILPILEETYGKGNGKLWFQRWRIFFMACAELWGYRRGREWWV
ncbi:MAG: class I SAM-dependent methyltransferase, partial [Candidatus Sumerlaeia bacterium]|nr:class I SAM-dependent methyltransferase [Candidatus Sumerlaeia bacterium]